MWREKDPWSKPYHHFSQQFRYFVSLFLVHLVSHWLLNLELLFSPWLLSISSVLVAAKGCWPSGLHMSVSFPQPLEMGVTGTVSFVHGLGQLCMRDEDAAYALAFLSIAVKLKWAALPPLQERWCLIRLNLVIWGVWRKYVRQQQASLAVLSVLKACLPPLSGWDLWTICSHQLLEKLWLQY